MTRRVTGRSGEILSMIVDRGQDLSGSFASGGGRLICLRSLSAMRQGRSLSMRLIWFCRNKGPAMVKP